MQHSDLKCVREALAEELQPLRVAGLYPEPDQIERLAMSMPNAPFEEVSYQKQITALHDRLPSPSALHGLIFCPNRCWQSLRPPRLSWASIMQSVTKSLYPSTPVYLHLYVHIYC